MKQIATLLAACTFSLAAMAQVSLTGTTPSYSQDFNTLDTASASTNTTLPAGWKIAEVGANANSTYRGGNGSSNTGDTWSYGAAGSTDRALGALASNNLRSHFGAAFINNTGAAITSVTITYRAEQWRAGDTAIKADSLLFYYSTSAADIDTGLAAWTEVPSMLTLSTNSVGTSNAGNATDGNTVFTNKTGTLQFPTPISNGATVRMKWVDLNILGSDDGIAIDDLTMAFTTGSGGGTSVANVSGPTISVSILGRATTDRILVGFTAIKQEAYTLALYDLNGREVAREVVAATAGENQVTLSPRSITAGQYILRVSNSNTSGMAKVVVE